MMAIASSAALIGQQTLEPRVAVYKTTGERFVVDSAQLLDSIVMLKVGDLTFDIDEAEFARLEPIPGATFSEPDQVYSLSLRNGQVIVGQVVKTTNGIISIRTNEGEFSEIYRSDIKGINIEKRNVFQMPHVKKCATTNFLSSPYALNKGEAVFSSFIYGNSIEIGLGKGISGKVLASVLPFVLPTGLELAYRKRLDNSNFSIGMSVGQLYLGLLSENLRVETVNSDENFITTFSSNFTYHMGDAFLKTGVTILTGNQRFDNGSNVFITSTYSMPGIGKPQNRWNFTANVVPNYTSEGRANLNINSVFLVGYQTHGPRTSYTVGLSLARSEAFTVIPFPYVYFSLYGSKEQRKVSTAFRIQRRMRFLHRTIVAENKRNKLLRERAAARELRRQRRLNK